MPLTDRALDDPDLETLFEALECQPSWSSVPFVMLCRDRDRDQSPAAMRFIDRLRNVTLLDRPASLRSMISAVQASSTRSKPPSPSWTPQRTSCGCSCPAHEVMVIGDRSRLSQAVGNLLNNAAKYTPNRGRITVSVAQFGNEVVVAVTDAGMGIPAAMLGRVFDLFAQVDRTLERAQGGLGIGLSLVRSLVGLHGGTGTVSSAGTDQGSTFEIHLPAVSSAATSDDARPADANLPPREQRRLRILVVDDNTDAADTLAMLLGMNGHEIRVEYNAGAAMNVAHTFLPEAIFCDLGMPGMGGHDFAAKLRRDRRFVSTLLIAVTGWGAEEDQRRSRAAGFDYHLTKPANADIIDAILSSR